LLKVGNFSLSKTTEDIFVNAMFSFTHTVYKFNMAGSGQNFKFAANPGLLTD